MSNELRAEQSAAHIQAILNRLWQANAENARYCSELATLRGKVRSLESLLDEKERRLILLTELLSRRGDQPAVRSPEQTIIEADVVT